MRNDRGFSLLEVMVAGSIGVTIIFYMYQFLANMHKEQKKIEKKMEFITIQSTLRGYLTDYKAWYNNPSQEPPRNNNVVDFHYYPPSVDRPVQLSVLGNKDPKSPLFCEMPWEGCRIIFFRYNGTLVPIKDVPKVGTEIFKAIIHITTPDSVVSKNYIPEMEIIIMDKTSERSTAVNQKMMFIGQVTERPKFDSLSMGLCFTNFAKKYPQKTNVGHILCELAKTNAPIECYDKMKSAQSADDNDALVVCSRSENMIPYDCFVKSKRNQSGIASKIHARLCNKATSEHPSQCFKLARALQRTTDELAADLCSQAQNLDPFDCFKSITNIDKSLEFTAVKLCAHYR